MDCHDPFENSNGLGELNDLPAICLPFHEARLSSSHSEFLAPNHNFRSLFCSVFVLFFPRRLSFERRSGKKSLLLLEIEAHADRCHWLSALSRNSYKALNPVKSERKEH